MPVRRIPGPGRANVYIVVSEIEAWLGGSTSSASSEQEDGQQARQEPKDPVHLSSPASDRMQKIDAGHTRTSPPFTDANRDLPLPSPGFKPTSRSDNFRRPSLILSVSLVFLALAAILARGRLHPGGSAALAHSSPLYVSSNSIQTMADSLYFEGAYFSGQRTPASLDHALYSFEEAITQNPKSARDYAGLATTYLLMREYGSTLQSEAYAKAEIAARRASALDPGLAESHADLGFIDFFFAWDPQRATREFETALRLDPSCALAHHWYGSMLTYQGLYSEALDQLDIALQLNPESAAILASRAYALGLSGHREEAFELLQPLVTGDRDSPALHQTLAALSLMEPRDIPRYLDESRSFAEMREDRNALDSLALASEAYKRDGEAAMWTALLRSERALHSSTGQPTYSMVEAQAALGQWEDATSDMNVLEKKHDPDMIKIGIDPLLQPLRDSPDFKQIEVAVGLQQSPQSASIDPRAVPGPMPPPH